MSPQSGSTLEPLAVILGCFMVAAVLLRRSPLRTLLVLGVIFAVVHFDVVPVPRSISARVQTLEGAGNYDSATCFFQSLLAGSGAGSAAQSCGAGHPSIPSPTSLPLISPRF
jgi:hypothetical protein